MDAGKLVQALAVTYGGVHLYPDPLAVPAFTQAVDTMGEFSGGSVTLTVTVDGFESRSGPIESSHGAAGRLVQALFSERVESLAVMGPPNPEDVVRFFEILEAKEDDYELDFPTRLQLAGVTAIRVRCQELLEDREDDDEEEDAEPEIERHPDVQELFETDSVRRIADRIMAAASPEAAAEEFTSLYRASYQHVTSGDPAGLERVVQTFVDAFFRLDHHYRVVVFESIVALRHEAPLENFIDQFSSDELAELAGEVKDSALPLLVEYARVVSEMAGRDPGLVDRVMADSKPADARGTVAGTVGLQLANFLKGRSGAAPSMDALRAEVEAVAAADRVGWVVLGDLFAIEQRPERQSRLLRIWAAKLSRAIRSEHFADGVQWLRLLDGIEIDPRLLDEAFSQVASDETLELLTRASGEALEERDELLQELSRRAGTRVLEQLAVEEDPGRRRMLIDIVTEIARVDIRSVLPGLADPRWYVVRNIAIALGKSGRKAAGEPLSRLISHDDHRVRIEALRAVLPCLGPAAVDHLIPALGDPHVRVRAAATDLLGTIEDEAVVPALTAALSDETQSVELRVAVIEALGRRPDDMARPMLQEMANSKARFSQSARTLRTAAREALRSSHG
ncbi:MAG: HEAT repeat domain-containing protein [Acidimicrobiia bacterium]|nr:HEAT repeat domain-containing protein [Acidimicrobiia bacterium]